MQGGAAALRCTHSRRLREFAASPFWRFQAGSMRTIDFLRRHGSSLMAAMLVALTTQIAAGQPSGEAANNQGSAASRPELSPARWQQLDGVVDRALDFLVTQQAADGSFPTEPIGQPAVTSLCVMAFLSRGHLPNEGPHGRQISRAIEYVLAAQQPNGLLCRLPAGSIEWTLNGSYNHAIAGVMLGEVYGMTRAGQRERVHSAIVRGLRFSRSEQKTDRSPTDRGGWRYLRTVPTNEADLSLTSWHLMFYRSAKNAEFDVPEQYIVEALDYVRRCYNPERGSFCYSLNGHRRNYFSRSMAGAGILSLSLAGEHQSEMAQAAGRFILAHPFDHFNRGGLTATDQYFYGAFYCSQAMFQLGGDEWKQFYTVLLDTLAENQRHDGAWEREMVEVGQLGLTYSTALGVLALTPLYQLLPIYQR